MQITGIGELPKQKQKFVMEMLETVLAQANAKAHFLSREEESHSHPGHRREWLFCF
ncbi:hypothetical protein [Massilia sp. TWP1-3-3]|uniref:hypothetical protein n=1 Tax=Massilia sp. TWP1-3-3 TaxID=2804573 RepID=UPI003CF16F2E